MPSLLHMARMATEGGLAFACAMCKHYWKNEEVSYEVRAQGRGNCLQTTCGGPMSGKTFPRYDGPLPDGDWSHLCFVCSSSGVTHGVRVVSPEATRLLGVCDEHARHLEKFAPDTDDLVVERPILLIPKADLGATRQAKRGT